MPLAQAFLPVVIGGILFCILVGTAPLWSKLLVALVKAIRNDLQKAAQNISSLAENEKDDEDNEPSK